MWLEIIHPLPNFNGATPVGVWEWISNLIPHFTRTKLINHVNMTIHLARISYQIQTQSIYLRMRQWLATHFSILFCWKQCRLCDQVMHMYVLVIGFFYCCHRHHYWYCFVANVIAIIELHHFCEPRNTPSEQVLYHWNICPRHWVFTRLLHQRSSQFNQFWYA